MNANAPAEPATATGSAAAPGPARAARWHLAICLFLCAACDRPSVEPDKARIAHAPTGSSLHLLEDPVLVCGLEKGVVRCVGPGRLEPGAALRLAVDEPVVALAGGRTHLCALGTSGAVLCAGDDYAPPELAEDAARAGFHAPLAIPLPGPARSLISADNRTCAVHASGRATCWSPGELTTYSREVSTRLNRLAELIGPQRVPRARRDSFLDPALERERFLRRLSALDIVAAHDVREFLCAIEASGTLHCRHGFGFPYSMPVALELMPVSLRCTWAGCCVRGTTGALECWATERDLRASIPVDAASFALGVDTVCFTARRPEGFCHRVSCMATPWIYRDRPSTYYALVDGGESVLPFYGSAPTSISLCIDLPRGGPNA